MTWEITWAPVLGFALSAILQTTVRSSTIVRLRGDEGLRSIAFASALGAACSSGSDSAVALVRSLFR